MAKLNGIGIDAKKASHLVDELNVLLANLSVFYQNVRGFHWNIRGEKFFELHGKFEELYTDLQLKIDEVAERILTLGGTPSHGYQTYLQESTIKVVENVRDGRKAVQSIVGSFGALLLLERDVLHLAADASDEGTNALMSDYIAQQEKQVWMYSAFLG
jgi:starvation-inducible DNA-binding protein